MWDWNWNSYWIQVSIFYVQSIKLITGDFKITIRYNIYYNMCDKNGRYVWILEVFLDNVSEIDNGGYIWTNLVCMFMLFLVLLW